MRIPAFGLAIAFVALGAGSTAAAEVSPRVPTAERTAPRLRPARGGPPTAFAVLFTLRETPGHQGIVAVDYRVEITSPQGQPATCTVPQPPMISEGEVGKLARVPLTPPTRGWCPGRYRASVFLERGPYCPPPPRAGSSALVCPLFATREIDTGEAVFSVTAARPQPVPVN